MWAACCGQPPTTRPTSTASTRASRARRSHAPQGERGTQTASSKGTHPTRVRPFAAFQLPLPNPENWSAVRAQAAQPLERWFDGSCDCHAPRGAGAGPRRGPWNHGSRRGARAPDRRDRKHRHRRAADALGCEGSQGRDARPRPPRRFAGKGVDCRRSAAVCHEP